MNKKVKELYDKLLQGVQEVFSSEKYAEFLEFSKNFRNYSFENTVLIFAQKPDATYVAGYKTWEKLGRHVKKGEKGIAIFAPLVKKEKIVNEETGEEEEITKLNGFRIVYVFDISQTEGKDIPSLVSYLETNTAEDLFQKLLKLSPVPVRYDNLPPLQNGYYSIDRKEIVLSSKIKGDQLTKTLLHEIVHSIVEDDTIKSNEDRRRAEIIAESVTYIVANHFGLDTSNYSFGYVAGWSGDPKRLIKWGSEIMRIANFIIDKISNIPVEEMKLAS
ncbi:ArdC family protein [Thermoanaerobacter thermohydrosulfuricus]